MTLRRRNVKFIKWQKLLVASLIIGFLAALLGIALKHLTEHFEEVLFSRTQSSPIYLIIFPFVGLSVIYILRQYLFKKKQNKGISEIFETLSLRKKSLPMFKIPSHFINGFITVIFGGSTGIEVSTVVATAAIGSAAAKKENVFGRYKTELICAGVAAGVTVLFSSPFAGLFFAYEVISKRLSTALIFLTCMSVGVAYLLMLVTHESALFPVVIHEWHFYAIPYFILLGLLAGIHSVYLTRCVLYIKRKFSRIDRLYHRVIIGSLLISGFLIVFPQLYGDGYHAVRELIASSETTQLTLQSVFTLIFVLLLKPVVTSITLSAGGDGGVFAPSLFMGAFLGLLVALFANQYMGANVIVVNFIIIGMAAMLSASIHAPFTALFLSCGLINDYTLFVPILAVCLISKYSAQLIYPHTVYSIIPKIDQ